MAEFISPESMSNDYLYPRSDGRRAMGMPGRLCKGWLFPVEVSLTETTTSNQTATPGTANETAATDDTPPQQVSSIYNLGTWTGFPKDQFDLVPWSTSPTGDRSLWGYDPDAVYAISEATEAMFEPMVPVSPPGSVDYVPIPDVLNSHKYEKFSTASGDFIYDGTYIWLYETWTRYRTVPADLIPEEDPAFPNAVFGPPTREQSVGQALANTARAVQIIKSVIPLLHKRPNVRAGKQFQFNPSALNLMYQMTMPVADAATLNPNGASMVSGVGMVTTAVNLQFDRTQEVLAAENGRAGVDPVFAKIGMQKDIFDVFRLLLGEMTFNTILQDVSTPGQPLSPTEPIDVPADAYMNGLNEALFDIGLAGGSLNLKNVIIYFNENLVLYGRVTGLNIIYGTFSSKLVPTIGSVVLDLEIMNISGASANNAHNSMNAFQAPLPGATASLSTSTPTSTGGTSTSVQRGTPRQANLNGPRMMAL